MKKMMKKNTKKKGFTLIELIAVIAILAILGAVLVPKISGYQNKAKKSNIQTSAKTMVHAIQAYNADANSTTARAAAATAEQGLTIVDGDKVSAAIIIVNLANGDADSTINTADDTYKQLVDLTVTQLITVSKGNFTYKITSSKLVAPTTVTTDTIAN
jgi:prepilin-type N-terminal cleavage/methylation domain-containing protein